LHWASNHNITKGEFEMSHLEMEIIGNVGRIEELRSTPNGHKVLNFTVAVNETYNDQERTTWIKAIAWNGLAEMLDNHLKTGQLVLIKGRPGTEAWTDKDGALRATLTITADTFRFLGKKPE
jgi:single-strand DNA-binding protein